MKKTKKIISLLTVLYLLSCAYLYFFQTSLLYFPTAEIVHTHLNENYSINGIEIKTIVLNPGKKNAVLYFGGNSESVAKTANTYEKKLPNHTVYFVNYRGYGGSGGSPREQDLYSDAQFIYDKVVSRHVKMSVMGRSLGSGIATYLASTRSIHKLILITPYDSIQNVAKGHYPLFPIELLISEKYDSASRVKNIQEDTLIILAENDTLIPFDRSNELIKKFPASQVTVKTIKKASHITLSHYKRYYSLIREFL